MTVKSWKKYLIDENEEPAEVNSHTGTHKKKSLNESKRKIEQELKSLNWGGRLVG